MSENIKEYAKAVACEVYSRIVGYFRPVKDWHNAKKEEFEARNYLNIEEKEDESKLSD